MTIVSEFTSGVLDRLRKHTGDMEGGINIGKDLDRFFDKKTCKVILDGYFEEIGRVQFLATFFWEAIAFQDTTHATVLTALKREDMISYLYERLDRRIPRIHLERAWPKFNSRSDMYQQIEAYKAIRDERN